MASSLKAHESVPTRLSSNFSSSSSSPHEEAPISSGDPSYLSQGQTTSPLPSLVTRSDLKPLPRTLDTLRNARHFFSRTPEELSDLVLEHAAFDHDQIQVSSSWGNYSPRSRYDPPDPYYVRVRLYQQIGNAVQATSLFDDVPVCHNGKLNLGPTMSKWNLQNMTVVDTDWTQYVAMSEPFTLSQETLESVVNEYQRLYILERPSPGRLRVRQLRRRLMKQTRRIGDLWRAVDPLDVMMRMSCNRGTTVVVVEEPSTDAASLFSWPSGVFSCDDFLS